MRILCYCGEKKIRKVVVKRIKFLFGKFYCYVGKAFIYLFNNYVLGIGNIRCIKNRYVFIEFRI